MISTPLKDTNYHIKISPYIYVVMYFKNKDGFIKS